MGKLRINLFGRLGVAGGDGAAIGVPGKKPQALLAYLALNAGKPQSRDHLAALLWGERFDEQARQSLRQGISKLRKALGDGSPGVLVTDGGDVMVNADAADIDTVDFERLAAEGTPDALAQAAGLCGGGLLDGLEVKEKGFEDWIAAERARFGDLASGVLARLARHQEEAGDADAAVETAKRLVGLDPLNEDGHRLLMRLYAGSGRRAQALKQFQALADALGRELGAEPDAQTRKLLDEIKDQDSPSPAPARVPPAADAPPHRDKPTVAVLPFDNMSGDADQEYFVDGITEDIITALSKNRWLSVIARNSTFGYKGQSPDVRRVAEELGADFVVEGSIRKVGDRVRITAQLIVATSGSHIWAERYDRDLDDIFAVQDEITETITATIEPELGAFESKRVKNKPTENLGAWDCYHLGLSHFYKFNTDDNAEAQRLFRRALELDPNFSVAHARLAFAIILSTVYFDAEPTPELLDEALHLAKKAASLDDQDAVAHFTVGRVHLARGEYDLSLAELETSIELNPTLAQAHCALGDSRAYAGQLEDSVSHFEEAIRLSPHDPYRWGFLMYGSLAHLFLKRHETAAEWANKAVRVPNSPYWANAALVAALGHLDRPDETREAVEELLRRKPEFTCSFGKDHIFYIKSSAQVDHYVEGLRKAGVPESAVTEPIDPAAAKPPLPDMPSVAVLPFENLSDDAEQEYFSDGIADDLITALSKVRSFFVIDRSSSFTYKGRAVDVKEIGRALGVRYVVEGSVRKAGERVRVTAQLIEAETGSHVWADRYDGALHDIFDLQDEIAANVVGAIEPHLHRAEAERIRLKRPESFDAYDLTLCGLAKMNKLTPEDSANALEFFQKAIEVDPTYARAYVCASWYYRRQVQLKGMVLSEDEKKEALRLVQAGLAADRTDPYVLWQAALTRALVERDFEGAMATIDRSLNINANSNRALIAGGMVRNCVGQPETAIEYAEKAIRLSPLDVSMWVAYGVLAVAHMQLGNYEEAVKWARKSVRRHRDHRHVHHVLVASLAQMGRQKEVEAALGDLMALDPELTVGGLKERFPVAGYRNLDGFMGGLRKAGLPD